MSILQGIRVTNLNKLTSDTAKKGSGAVSRLNEALSFAIKIGCKIHDANDVDIDDEFSAKLQSDLDNSMTDISECLVKISELKALREDPTTAAVLLSKYNINLADLNKELEQS